MAVSYSESSPYYNAPIINGKMGIVSMPSLPKFATDSLVTLSDVYENRPDLLSYDLYGTVNYWWVFVARNPSIIEDSIFDFKAGMKLYIPRLETIQSVVG